MTHPPNGTKHASSAQKHSLLVNCVGVAVETWLTGKTHLNRRRCDITVTRNKILERTTRREAGRGFLETTILQKGIVNDMHLADLFCIFCPPSGIFPRDELTGVAKPKLLPTWI
jgi:hypothetical protein